MIFLVAVAVVVMEDLLLHRHAHAILERDLCACRHVTGGLHAPRDVQERAQRAINGNKNGREELQSFRGVGPTIGNIHARPQHQADAFLRKRGWRQNGYPRGERTPRGVKAQARFVPRPHVVDVHAV